MPRALALTCFFLSGAAGLIYETCWVRTASFAFGSTTAALSTVLAVFFLGLATGSWALGNLAQRSRSPLRLYAALELLLAALALASGPGFAFADHLYGWLFRRLADNPGLLIVGRGLLVGVILFPPTFVMGGTLPLLCRQLVADPRGVTGSIGLLYAINTLGAAVGCAATGFVLLPRLGTTNTMLLGAALTIAAAVGALVAARRLRPPRPAPATAGRPTTGRRIGVLFFGAGFLALGLQVLWARYLGLIVRNTVHTYTLTLTVVLVGIVIGSLAARVFDRLSGARELAFGALLAGGGLSAWATMHLPPSTWRGIDDLAAYGLLMLPAAIASGAVFPLGIRLALADPTQAGATTGRLAAANTLGGIVGALVVGFIGLPQLGLQISAHALGGLAVVLGGAAWLGLGGAHTGATRKVACLVAVLLGAAIPWLSGVRLPADFLSSRERLAAWHEGWTANLAAVRRDDGALHLEIDRWWQGSDIRGHQIVAAHLPMLLHPAPAKVLVVGVGTGQAPSRFLLWDIEQLDAVDIEPALFDFVARHFDDAWMNHPAVRLLREDGRDLVAHGDDAYDVISLEVGQLFRPGAASFYSQDFYERAVERLRAGGILTQFVPLAFLGDDGLRRVVGSFLAVFPQAQLWYNTQEMLLVGRRDQALRLEPSRLERLATDPKIQADLRWSAWGGEAEHLNQPEAFLAGFFCGPDDLARMAANTTPLRDDRPYLEYVASALPETAQLELDAVLTLRQHLTPIEAILPPDSAWDGRRITDLRRLNLADLAANAHVRRSRLERRRGDAAAADAMLTEALRANPQSAVALRHRAKAAQSAGDLATAERDFDTVIQRRPDDAEALRELGLVLLRTGRERDAKRRLEAALRLRPDDAIARNYLGATLARIGDWEEAKRQVERALELRPGYASALTHLGHIRDALGQ
ncbi:MAG: fused MFS/spermidine synthase [Planctomycetota bacterium]